MTFVSAVLNTPVETQTHNGMKAFKSSLSHNTDLFYKIGASRGQSITNILERAYLENREAALRILQWARDVRGGAGERQLFREGLLYLEKNYKSDLLETRILENVAEIGRFDDLLIFTDKDVKSRAFDIILHALDAGNGLAAKWMPRKGPLAAELRNTFGWTPKFYRKRLVELTKVVETPMCAKQWDDINFSHVPSLAMSRYSKAFGRNAPEKFTTYKEALKTGSDPQVKVNAGAVYPYDIAKNVIHGDSQLADEQWKALPNFIGDARVIAMVDVSGSMTAWDYYTSRKGNAPTVSPMDVAVSLGVYCAEKNTGDFKDLVLTFTDYPEFVHTQGTATQRLKQVYGSRVGYSTDIERGFMKILEVATKNKVPEEDMPQALLVLSDMQFDASGFGASTSALESCKKLYEVAGYKMPALVFWNLNAHDNVPVRYDERGTALVSGFSPSIMKSVLSADFDNMTPEGIMWKTVFVDRYDF